MTFNEKCFWCGHMAHDVGTTCGTRTHILRTPCECRGVQEPRCLTCGRRVELVEGVATHRFPRPAAAPAGDEFRRYGAELALHTMAISDHEARVA